MAAPRPATTVLVLRPDADGYRVFLVQRHRSSGFMPSAWVFPGGRVDRGDHLVGSPALRGGGEAVARMGLPVDEGIAFLVAGVRETFEETGIWLGDGNVPERERRPLGEGKRTLGEVLADHRATVDLDRLHPWSWWTTPEAEPKRFDTRFLVTVAEDARGRHDTWETVDSGWFTPAEAVAAADEGRFPLAPPTWWTLRELTAYATVRDVLRAAAERPQRCIQPILRMEGATLEVLFPGHPEHPDAAIPGIPPRVTFAQGRWWIPA